MKAGVLARLLAAAPADYDVVLSESGFMFPMSDDEELDIREDCAAVVLWGGVRFELRP